MEVWICRLMDVKMKGWMARWKCGCIDGSIDILMDGCLDGKTDV